MSSSVTELGGEGRLTPTDDRPLTDQEYQMLQRLLSDPFSLPIQFKTWLVSYLEGSDLTLPMSAIAGLVSTLGISGVGGGTLGIFPAGIILPYGGDVAPPGSLMCDGGLHVITSEQRLYNAIGNRFSYGRPAPPAGQFYVPDGPGRGLVMKGPHVDVDAVGKHEGLPANARRPKHKTSVVVSEVPHSHAMPNPAQAFNKNAGSGAAGAAGGDRNIVDVVSTNASSTNIGVTAGPQGGDAPVDTAAFLAINFIIIA